MIGIYGGTFDPVHYGHLRTALEVKEIFALDELRLIPCYQSPLKNSSQATPAQRLEMLERGIANQTGFICDSRELDRAGRSYMVDTLTSLRNDFPAQSLILFMGGDAFAQLESWYQWQRLFDYAHIVVITRPHSEKPSLAEFLNQRLTTQLSDLKIEKHGRLFFQTVTQLDISATAIRALQAQKRSIRFLLPDNVIDSIERYKLYQT